MSQTGPGYYGGVAENHCGRCKLNYCSPSWPKYSRCPRCGAHGDYDGYIVPWQQEEHGPMSNVHEE